jgi:hypothetical protein
MLNIWMVHTWIAVRPIVYVHGMLPPIFTNDTTLAEAAVRSAEAF